jgi:hypothetical protein
MATSRRELLREIAQQIADEADILVRRETNEDIVGWWREFGPEYVVQAAVTVLDRRCSRDGRRIL